MRISTEQIEIIKEKYNFMIIDDGHESLRQLEDSFGSHTFFLSDDGLLILEEEKVQHCESDPLARITFIAIWEDGADSRLLIQTPPVATDVVVNLSTGEASEKPQTD